MTRRAAIVGGAMTAPHLHSRDFTRTTLRPRHRTLMPKLAEAYFAYDGPLDPAMLEAFSREVDRAISTASKTLRFGLVLMLDFILWSPLFIIGKLSTFEGLSLEDRGRFLMRLERSKLVPLTLVFIAWKTLLTMLFYEEPEELKALGYPGPERTRYLTILQAPEVKAS
jgi:hypothetical protein